MENIFVVPVLEQWLLHGPLHAIAALMNDSAVERLKTSPLLVGSTAMIDIISAVRKPPESTPAPQRGPLNPDFLGLIPTRTCNLSCVYCGFGASTAGRKSMDMDTVISAVDWMADHVQKSGKNTLDIHFFGGEPFIAWDVVEAAVHRARLIAARRGLVAHFEASTNGVLKESQARFVGDYFDVIVLSFDGPKEIHDKYRSRCGGRGSYEEVFRTAKALSKSQVKLCLRACVTKETVKEMEKTADWFCRELQPSAINFETLQPTDESRAAGLITPDPYEFACNFISARRIMERYGVRSVYAADLSETPQLSFCPAGKDALILSPDKRASVCYLQDKDWQDKGMDMDIGKLDGKGRMRFDADSITKVHRFTAAKKRCEKCFCRWSCAGGCHVNHSYPGCAEAYDDFCIQTRIITACSLLSGLGQEPLAKKLLKSRSAMKALAFRESDRIPDWN